MGITGLLPYLKKIHNPINISKFEGCTVAIDAYCWLHKGAFSCADKLALGEETDQYVYYCMKYVNCLLGKNIRPILVFDGCHLPSKGDVEKTRRERRETYRKKAAAFLREGRRAEAKECLQRCVDISPQMALKLITACRDRGIDCIVAPYEADAQLAFLNKSGVAQVIITEDSDLLLFGCDRIVFKMDFFGNGTLVEKSQLNEVLQINSDCYTFDKFRQMCILSGCDYLPSLPGIGLAKANKVFKMARQPDLKLLLKKIPSYLKMKIMVTDEYINGFLQAENTFLYQLVYNPMVRKLVPLTPYPPDLDPQTLHYAGPVIPADQALQIALGNLDVSTKKRIANFDPETFRPRNSNKKATAQMNKHSSIWDRNFKVQSKISLKENSGEITNLLGKEKTVSASFLKRRSPVKRKRESVDPEELKTDSELVSLYDDSEPKKKQCLRDIENIVGSNMHDDQEEDDEKAESVGNFHISPKGNSHKSPQKHRGVPVTAADVWELASAKQAADSSRTSEKKVTPVKLNKFAVSSSSTKAKFNLNASRSEVRSRYFANNDQLKMNRETNSVKVEINKDSVSPPSSGIKSGSPTENKTVSISSISSQTERKFAQKTSRGSVFNWSKFTSSTKTFSSSQEDRQSNETDTMSTSSEFSRTCVEKKTLTCDSQEYKQSNDMLDKVDSSPEERLRDIETSVRTEDKHISIDLTNCPDEAPESSSTTLVIPPAPRLSSQSHRGSPAPCRVPGLSRSSKKKSQIGTSGSQKNIKEMFSKFSFKKTVLP